MLDIKKYESPTLTLLCFDTEKIMLDFLQVSNGEADEENEIKVAWK